ncbi:hypothetical protein GALMADRAFT_158176 [Galerina marginata CBS 339.88]|uniref:Chromo domain-containing protein n=1 Tax=Galerina marginata (strain CBS 339.88) TaxID=685588 RepID=A0A067SS33_GALM3|nr:hypothetical protein GALMADRAFT_158176 [Galerina marginata CBS 339.88]
MARGRKPKNASTLKIKEPLWRVEVITEARRVPSAEDIKEETTEKKKAKRPKKVAPRWEYLVEWAGLDNDGKKYLPTWEPQENLQQCERLVKGFWENVGPEKRQYEVGFVLKPDEDWIESEKKLSKELEDTDDDSTDDDTPCQQLSTPLTIIIPKWNGSTTPNRKRTNSSRLEEECEPIPASTSAFQKRQKVVLDSSSDLNPTLPIAIAQPPQASSLSSGKALTPKKPPASRTVKRTPKKAAPLKVAPFVHPQAKIPLQSSVSAATGISTKARLAENALDPTLPKERAIMQLPRKSSSRKLGSSAQIPVTKYIDFKKDLQVRSSAVNHPRLPTPDSNLDLELVIGPLNSLGIQSSPIMSDPFESSANPCFTSGISVIEDDYSSYIPNGTISPALISPPSPVGDVEIPHDIMDLDPASLFSPGPEEPMEVEAPILLHQNLPTPGRLPKIWKWCGPLYIASQKSSVYTVKLYHLIKDQTKFSEFFKVGDEVEVSCFHDIMDIRTNLQAFQPPSQMALLGVEENKDVVLFKFLLSYMEKAQKVFTMPIIQHEILTGHVIFFSYACGFSMLGRDIPAEFNQPGNLVAAILLYSLSHRHLKFNLGPLKNINIPPLDTTRQAQLLNLKYLKYQHAAQVLGLAPFHRLYKFMAAHPRTKYCVWSGEGPEEERKSINREMSLLLSVMGRMQGQLVTGSREAKIIFIHAGFLSMVSKLHSFAESCSSQATHFYLYGTHQDVSPSLWGIQEIYPCGGIVTFTPSAIMADPIAVIHVIRQISAHPQWACYILPAALGMVAKLESSQNKDLDNLQCQRRVTNSILEAVNEGAIALLHAPPLTAGTVTKEGDAKNWMLEYFAFIPPCKQTTLQAGFTAFSNTQRLSELDDVQQQIVAMNSEIVKDMTLMQLQPVFVKQYRRYIVIDSEAHAAEQPSYIQGLEWTSTAKFDFKDDFYPKQTIGDNGL